jgi:hypothetical protein
MDPQTDNELQLTDDHLRMLQARWRSPETESRYILSELPNKARYLVTPVPYE